MSQSTAEYYHGGQHCPTEAMQRMPLGPQLWMCRILTLGI